MGRKDDIVQFADKHGPVRRADVAEEFGIKENYAGALLAELADEEPPRLRRVVRDGTEVEGLYTLPEHEDTEASQESSYPSTNGESDDVVSLLQNKTVMTIYTGVRAAAGEGRINYPDDQTHEVELPAGLLAEVIGFRPPSRIGIMWAEGDSMEPSIYDEEMVIYKPVEQIQASGIYVVYSVNGLIVKRIHPHLDGSLTVISDNDSKGYSPEELVPDDSGHPHQFIRESTGRSVQLYAVGRVLFPDRDTDKMHIKQVTQLIQGVIGRGQDVTAEALSR